MKIFLDTEFQEYAPDRYTLISLAAVREDGAEFYQEANWWNPLTASEWLQKNVVPHLRGPLISKANMAREFKEFCGFRPEFWGYYSTHDWFLICDMLGGFLTIPPGWPQWCNDIQTVRTLRGTLHMPNLPNDAEHDALADARWTAQMHRAFVVG